MIIKSPVAFKIYAKRLEEVANKVHLAAYRTFPKETNAINHVEAEKLVALAKELQTHAAALLSTVET